jgi:hypothetical protein
LAAGPIEDVARRHLDTAAFAVLAPSWGGKIRQYVPWTLDSSTTS